MQMPTNRMFLREDQRKIACKRGGLSCLGLDCSQFYNITAVEEVISMADKKFDLVLILELWSESLIFFKQLLNLDLEDIIQPKLNFATEEKEELTKENQQFLRKALWPEYLLYNHFKKKMSDKISAHKEYLERELARYEKEMDFVNRNCQFGLTPKKGHNAFDIFLKEDESYEFCKRFLNLGHKGVEEYMRAKYQSIMQSK